MGFPRLFCDIHCVRDAVIRGDRTILRNLEKATKISNHNMQKMVEWSTEAARTESEYLDKKIDHSLKINTIYLEHIAKNTQPPEEDLIQNAARATRTMLGELRGLADTSSFGISRIATGDALDRFVAGAEPLTADNLTAARAGGEVPAPAVVAVPVDANFCRGNDKGPGGRTASCYGGAAAAGTLAPARAGVGHLPRPQSRFAQGLKILEVLEAECS